MDTDAALSQRPHLILTLRRTGGTALMTFLDTVSAFPPLQHEPFNPDRVWGDLTRAFVATGDGAALAAGLAARLEGRPNIKHCFEIVDLRITLALVEACAARGYAIFLLTRRDEAGRLRSLFLAHATGAWGAEAAAGVYPRIRAGKAALEPLDLRAVRQRHATDASALGVVLRLLRHRAIAHDWLVFEEIYAPGDPSGGDRAGRARALAARIGAQLPPDDPRLRRFAEDPGQGSAAMVPFLPNARAFEKLLGRLCLC